MSMKGWLIIGGLGLILISGGVFLTIDRRLLKSNKATREGISNAPDPEDVDNLKWLSAILPTVESLVREIDPSARLSSAYRSDALNTAVGGSSSSEHRLGLAVDFSTDDPVKVAKYVRDNEARLPARPHQVIAELSGGGHGAHLHIGWSRRADHSGSTQYLSWQRPNRARVLG